MHAPSLPALRGNLRARTVYRHTIISAEIFLKKTEGKISFAKAYFGWMFQVGENTKDVVGFATEKDWLPEVNGTNSTNSSED